MLVGRENESQRIRELLVSWLDDCVPHTLCIKGLPGTGKTATVQAVVDSLRDKKLKKQQFNYVYVNCLGISKQTEFCCELYARLPPQKSPKKLNVRNALKESEMAFIKNKTLLVLDEVDNLASMNRTLLPRVFTWPHLSVGKVFLIGSYALIKCDQKFLGICNSLDFVEKHLARMPTKKSVVPENLVFAAYTSTQIVSILHDRLKNKKSAEEDSAIILCAKKVAAMTGDVRRAIAIADEMIKMRPPVETLNSSICTPMKNKENLRTPVNTPPRTPSSACRDVLAIINRCTASPAVRSKLPFQPKLLLACILRLTGSGRAASLTSQKLKKSGLTRTELYAMYSQACKKLNADLFSTSTFDSIEEGLHILRMQGLIQIKKDIISILVEPNAARGVIADIDLIASINEIPI